MSKSMLNKDFYKLRRDFNPRVVPSVDFVPSSMFFDTLEIKRGMPYPDPFGGELPLDAVKANPKRGSSADKKEAFQDFLNSATGQLVAQVPSQMPGAMGGGFGHGIAGNVADIQQLPYRYGDQTGGFNIMNPFTYGNMKRVIEGTRAGDKNMEYSNSPAGQIGKAANERNRLIQEMLGGY